MALTASFYPLSALNPVKFTYKYNLEEKLAETINLFNGGFRYYEYQLFKGFKDAAISKHNGFVLTDVKPLESVFEEKPETLFLGSIAGCVY